MIFDPEYGEVKSPVTYGNVYVYCQYPMGAVSMLDFHFTREANLEGRSPEPEHLEALENFKNAARDLIEHIVADVGCEPRKMHPRFLRKPLPPATEALYDIMIERQHELQRLIGQPEGPVPVCI